MTSGGLGRRAGGQDLGGVGEREPYTGCIVWKKKCFNKNKIKISLEKNKQLKIKSKQKYLKIKIRKRWMVVMLHAIKTVNSIELHC